MATAVYIVGARPNFVKMAPLLAAMSRRPGIRNLLVHTGQHYDAALSADVLADLELPRPHSFLDVGSGSRRAQLARAIAACEALLVELRPRLVVVAGDVNSTLAGGLAAAKLQIPVAHLEAGLRSFDWSMPEEGNRVLTDRLSDVLLTHSPEAWDNLLREGIDPARITLVGNTMVDSLRRFEGRARERATRSTLGLEAGSYVLATLHRPSNVDDQLRLTRIASALVEVARHAPVVLPAHPRTRARLEAARLVRRLERAGVRLLAAQGYLDFLSLEMDAGAVVTDSGGVQEETSALGVPCFTLRRNTERPITVSHGTNVVLGEDPAAIAAVRPGGSIRTPAAIPLWDGRAAERAADVLREFLARLERGPRAA